jgi:hypothetical protein
MPESVTDRPTKAHEYVFLLTKSARYFYDADAVREPASPLTVHPSDAVANTRPYRGFTGQPNKHHCGGTPAGRNLRSVWAIPAAPFPDAHFATFPPALAQRCLLAGCPLGGTVLDPFAGSGTVGQVAEALGRRALLIELAPPYIQMATDRTRQRGLFSHAPAVECG